MAKQEYDQCAVFVSLDFEHFKEKIAHLLSCKFRRSWCKQSRLVKPWFSFDLNFIFKSYGTGLLERTGSYKPLLSFFQEKNRRTPSFSASRHVSSSLSMYLFQDFYDSNGGVKVQVKRAFKIYFLSRKNNKNVDRTCMKFSSAFNTSVQRCVYRRFQNQQPHFLFLHQSITAMVLENSFQEFNVLYFCGILNALSLQIISWIFFLYVPPWLQRSFEFMVLRLQEKTFASHLRFYYHPSRQKEITDLCMTFLTISLTIFKIKTFILAFFFPISKNFILLPYETNKLLW